MDVSKCILQARALFGVYWGEACRFACAEIFAASELGRCCFKEITETDESGVAEFSFPIAQDFLVGLGVVYRVVFSAWVLHGAAF